MVQKNQEQIKNHSLKQMIRGQQKEAQEKKQRDLMERQMRAKQQIEDKTLNEDHKRIEHQSMIERMEREELELIQRLQNTQLLQKAAYEDLESALTGGQVQFEGAASVMSSSRPATAGNYRQQQSITKSTSSKTGARMW